MSVSKQKKDMADTLMSLWRFSVPNKLETKYWRTWLGRTFKKKDQIITLNSKNAVKIREEVIHIDPKLLFQRLVTVGIKNDNLAEVFPVFWPFMTKLWNSLPKHLRTINNLTNFKKSLKTHLSNWNMDFKLHFCTLSTIRCENVLLPYWFR